MDLSKYRRYDYILSIVFVIFVVAGFSNGISDFFGIGAICLAMFKPARDLIDQKVTKGDMMQTIIAFVLIAILGIYFASKIDPNNSTSTPTVVKQPVQEQIQQKGFDIVQATGQGSTYTIQIKYNTGDVFVNGVKQDLTGSSNTLSLDMITGDNSIIVTGYNMLWTGTYHVMTKEELIMQEAIDKKNRVQGCMSAWDGSNRSMVSQVQKGMNDPDSFEHDETRYKYKGDDVVLYMSFRGNNAFGGKVLNVVQGTLDTTDCTVYDVKIME